MTKRLIKLINCERLNARIESKKACATTSHDVCTVDTKDIATCSVYAYDQCGKDYSPCTNGADDYCGTVDNDGGCHGAGKEDYCSTYDYTD